MSKVVELHPSVREHLDPQVSAAALAEYLILRPDQQDSVLHNSRFSTPPVVVPHSGALKPIIAYNSDPNRKRAILDSAKGDLAQRALDKSIRPKAQEESRRCVETIELFERAENAFGLRALDLSAAPRFSPLVIDGVKVSVQPHLLVNTGTTTSQRFGTVFFRPQKAPDPSQCRMEKTRQERNDHRHELAWYILAMAEMLWDRESSAFDRSASFVADIRIGERIDFSPSDHRRRIKSIEAACGQIKRLWDSIEPRNSIRAKKAGG